MNQKGVRDLMDSNRYTYKHISEELEKNGVPGNWDIYMNVYNLINGRITPKDCYIYILMSELFHVDIKTILMRYSSAISKVNETAQVNELDW